MNMDKDTNNDKYEVKVDESLPHIITLHSELTSILTKIETNLDSDEKISETD